MRLAPGQEKHWVARRLPGNLSTEVSVYIVVRGGLEALELAGAKPGAGLEAAGGLRQIMQIGHTEQHSRTSHIFLLHLLVYGGLAWQSR